MRKIRSFEPLTKKDKKKGYYKELGSQMVFLGIEGLEPSRFLKSTDFPLTINFIVAGIDM